jgi:ABC-type glycerol-3-phosphate transport system permease component
MKKVFRVAAIGVVAFLVLLPFLWTLSSSFKSLPEVNRYPPQWTSGDMSVMPYFDMFFYMPFATYTLNSLVVASAATIIALFTGSLAAFAFSRFQFAGKQLFLLVFLLSQMLPGASVIIPLFQLLNAMGLYDTHAGLILVHSAVLLPFVIWLLYGFFQAIPREVEDAALIDGCSRLTALRRVILPLALPGIGATALFAFLGSWNEFFFALILTSSDATKTIPVGIGLFVGEYNGIWNQMAASAVLFSLPPLLLFALMRKTFVKGLLAGGVK